LRDRVLGFRYFQAGKVVSMLWMMVVLLLGTVSGNPAGKAKEVPDTVTVLVRFESVPDSVFVGVDSERHGFTPWNVMLTRGDHYVKMGKEGFTIKKGTVKVASEGQVVAWTLAACKDTSMLRPTPRDPKKSPRRSLNDPSCFPARGNGAGNRTDSVGGNSGAP